MPIVSSLALVVALVLAVVIGPQTRPWTWGPAMLALAISNLAALPVFWKRGKFSTDIGLLAFGALTAGWFAWRAWTSPVADLGQADLLLLVGAVGTFVSIRAITGHDRAECILTWGIAMLLLASVGVAAKQIFEPSFTPVFRSRGAEKMVSGFFAHYNEAANYFIASSMLVGAAAFFGRHHPVTRIFWGLIAAAGLAAVYFTHSRGGILGAAVACGVFAAVGLMIGKRQRAKWFAPAMIAAPILGILIAGFLFVGWQETQKIRDLNAGIETLLDNNSRLYMLGIALSCIAIHPLSGGGSRSFSWECFQFAEGKSHSDLITHKPELVHNELAQAATDYGLIGAGLLAVLLIALVLGSILRALFDEQAPIKDSRDAWRVGGMAALAGMLVQSCFSFVFHLFPGILLLGLCLGMLSRTQDLSPCARGHAAKLVLSIGALFSLTLLIPYGWKGTRLTQILWPSYFSKAAIKSTESTIDALTEAVAIWPQSSLYVARGIALEAHANAGYSSQYKSTLERAISDYHQASQRHPFDPTPVINSARLLSALQEHATAEEAFSHAIALQGGMESAFRGHYLFALHLLKKGNAQQRSEQFEASLASFKQAADEIEKAVAEMHWILPDMREPRVLIHEYLGNAHQVSGNSDGALEAYNFTASLPGGQRAHYLAALLLGKKAVETWSDRKPSEALKWFIEARKHVGQAGGQLPHGITPEQRKDYITYLDRNIAFLKGAKVQLDE